MNTAEVVKTLVTIDDSPTTLLSQRFRWHIKLSNYTALEVLIQEFCFSNHKL